MLQAGAMVGDFIQNMNFKQSKLIDSVYINVLE